MWHASVSWQTRQGPLPVAKLRRWQRKEAVKLLHQLLGGVGTGRAYLFVMEPPLSAVHLQRRLSVEELAILPPEWLAIAPRDEIGPTRAFKA